MPKFEQHCRDCEHILGKPFKEVNLWMDELQATYSYNHRKFRHTLEGIETARELFGDEGAKAAEVHILRDMNGIPRDSKDYEHGDFTQWKYYREDRFKYPEIEE